jgi:phosphate starvation-inducible protein PhoH
MLGAYNGHLKQIEQRLDVTISHRGDAFYVDGEMDAQVQKFALGVLPGLERVRSEENPLRQRYNVPQQHG